MKSFGEKLTMARKAHGMTQDQLAERMNVVRSTISNWEIGRAQPGYDALCQLARILQYDFLLDRQEDDSGENRRIPLSEQGYMEVNAGKMMDDSWIRQINSIDIRINGGNQQEKAVYFRIFIPFERQ